MSSGNMSTLFEKSKPFLLVVFLQVGLSGMDIISKVALDEGMSNYVFVVYRHLVATLVMAPFVIVLDRNKRPTMTTPIFMKLMLLALLEPVLGQILYFEGMKLTTATFAVAMCNLLPAITFLTTFVLRLEAVNIRSIRSQAKIIGTITTVGGTMIMTLLKGPMVFHWAKGSTISDDVNNGLDTGNFIKGAIMIAIGMFSWSCFFVLQAMTLTSYPAELSLTAWICLLGTAEGAIVALVMEGGNRAAWAIKLDMTLLATLYSGIICSGLAFYVQAIVMKSKDPVFVTAFSPLNMILVAIMGAMILKDRTYLGGVIGAVVIVLGLYLVVWGKSNENNREGEAVTETVITINTDAGGDKSGDSGAVAAGNLDTGGIDVGRLSS